jgi:hypothetical protein
VRPHAPDQPDDARHRLGVVERRDVAVELRDRVHLDPELVGDERHRALAAPDDARGERRLVAPLREALGEVRDVQRRPAHVQARDQPEHADRLSQALRP